MKKASLVTIMFMVIASAITAGAFWLARGSGVEKGGAASFGISPSYLKFENLKAGEEAVASIRVMRGDDEKEQKVIARFDGLEVADWISTEPSQVIVLKKDEEQARFNFKIKVPEDASDKTYDGKLYFILGSDERSAGVGIGLGAKADVEISVGGVKNSENKASTSPVKFTLAENALTDRLRGYLLMRVEAEGRIFYIHPQEDRMYYLGNKTIFSDTIKNIGREIDNEVLNKIALDLDRLGGHDSDGDGLPDSVEISMGTKKDTKDSDADGANDLDELRSGQSPLERGKQMAYDKGIASSLAGFFLRQDNPADLIWYVDPKTKKRILVEPSKFPEALKGLSLGISDETYGKLLK